MLCGRMEIMLHGHKDLKVYQLAYNLAMEIFHASKAFPKEEKYSLTHPLQKIRYRNRVPPQAGEKHCSGTLWDLAACLSR